MSDFDPGSFRDRAGRVFHRNGEIFRGVRADALAAWRDISGKPFYRELARERKIVTTSEEPSVQAPEWDGVLRHEKIPVISYPYEWPFGMLRRAAQLQLELIDRALTDGVTLRDATPFNVQWIGSSPIFIDVLSFALLREGGLWTGYRQFCEQFLYPLMLESYRKVPFQPWFRGSLEGIDAETASRLLLPSRALRPGVLKHVYLHAALQRRFRSHTSSSVAREIASRDIHTRELIRGNVRNLARIVDGLSVQPEPSPWTDYELSHSYSSEDRATKERFVTNALAVSRPVVTFDIGCNTGAFSEIAAAHCPTVVAADADHRVIDRLFSRGSEHILPLVWDFANPSPGLGWRGRERPSLEERFRPGLVLALALIHHVVLGRNVLLADFVDALAELGGDAVVEWVDRSDPMAARLLAQKDDSFADYTIQNFERELARAFIVETRTALSSGNRVLYLVRTRLETRPR